MDYLTGKNHLEVGGSVPWGAVLENTQEKRQNASPEPASVFLLPD